ncbi:hypothetical protein Y032_0336g2889 [Ancylostoma ceylanicum]|nr:hypothetical protein Y032_0336g2889 [Ancylostoma ceylanicum]
MKAFLSVCVILFALFESLLAQGNATTAAPTRPPWPKPNCGNAQLTNSVRNLILNLHNNFRGSVARGQTEVSAGWGIAPPATIMYRMKYDCNAESYAQQAVSTCRKTPLPEGTLGGHKQNLHILNTVQTTTVGAVQNAIATWWSQLARFGMRSNMMFYQSEFQRGSRNVLSWSKVRMESKEGSASRCALRRELEFACRWRGGTTDALDVLCNAVAVTMSHHACTALEETMSTNTSTVSELCVLTALLVSVMVKLCVGGNEEESTRYQGDF